MYRLAVESFEEWRTAARMLLAKGIPPTQVEWQERGPMQDSLLDELFAVEPVNYQPQLQPRVPPDFIELAQRVACHRHSTKWSSLYTLLWRIAQGEKNLLKISTDPLVNSLLLMQKSVRRDVHKMTAFVRFQLVETGQESLYVAWYEPDHKILNRIASFFRERFNVQKWIILTPDGSVAWDGDSLHFDHSPMSKIEVDSQDKMELLWKTYYRATFNPARIKISAMKREMPVRFWKNLPETKLISPMLKEAPQRVVEMLRHSGIKPGMLK